MTKKEYLKYNNIEAFDMQSNPIKPGDTVVINNYRDNSPIIGIVDHFTESGNLAIYSTIKKAYRHPRQTIKIKSKK